MDEVWAKLFVEEVKQFVARSSEKLKSDLRAEFESRFVALEEGAPRFRGVYVEGEAYSKGQLVVHAGSLWFCRAGETSSRPGVDANWQLCCKAGTFGK